MSDVDRLVELQEVDLQADDVAQQLQAVEAQLGPSSAAEAARADLARRRARLHRVEVALKEREWDASQLDEKIAAVDKKLYGGTVRNPRELSDLQRDVEGLRHNKSGLEERMLALMDEQETESSGVRNVAAEFERLTTAWTTEQAELKEKRGALRERLAALGAERARRAEHISAPTLAIYDERRRTRRGRAVAKVERNMCLGCRTSLALHEVQRARAGRELAFCSSCGRILHVTR